MIAAFDADRHLMRHIHELVDIIPGVVYTHPELATAGLTVIPFCVPLMVPVTVSVAVIDWLPAVFNVALKVCAPASALTNV